MKLLTGVLTAFALIVASTTGNMSSNEAATENLSFKAKAISENLSFKPTMDKAASGNRSFVKAKAATENLSFKAAAGSENLSFKKASSVLSKNRSFKMREVRMAFQFLFPHDDVNSRKRCIQFQALLCVMCFGANDLCVVCVPCTASRRAAFAEREVPEQERGPKIRRSQ